MGNEGAIAEMTHENGTTGVPLTREQVLDELDVLATVEHAVCVEYLSIHCALGHALDPADASPTAEHVAAGARAAAVAAQDEMRHLHGVNRALVRAGRSPELGRASSIGLSSGSDLALGPLRLEQLERLVEREHDLAKAVDARYARLRPAVAAPTPVFDGELLDEMRRLLHPPPDHSGLATALRDELTGVPPKQYLRATPREPVDDLERALLDLSDHSYRLVVEILESWFAHEDELIGGRGQAVDAMTSLDMVNQVLVRRGVLPPFTPRR
jgi:hypothetical protein